MRFIIKMMLYGGLVVGGSFLAIDRVPWLKANLLEIVNPRVQEGELVRTLQQNLEQLDAALPDDGTVSSAVVQSSKKLISESQDLIQQIADINDTHDGIVSGIVSKVTDTIIGTAVSSSPTPITSTASATSSPSPAASPCAP